jgi:hypothetical protein
LAEITGLDRGGGDNAAAELEVPGDAELPLELLEALPR